MSNDYAGIARSLRRTAMTGKQEEQQSAGRLGFVIEDTTFKKPKWLASSQGSHNFKAQVSFSQIQKNEYGDKVEKLLWYTENSLRQLGKTGKCMIAAAPSPSAALKFFVAKTTETSKEVATLKNKLQHGGVIRHQDVRWGSELENASCKFIK